MSRRPLPSGPSVVIARSTGREPAVTYQVWLPNDQITGLKPAHSESGQSWPDWTEAAIARLSKVHPSELRDLLAAWSRTRAGKSVFSFRLYQRTLDAARDIALENDVTVQAVFGHAHYMQTLATGTDVSQHQCS